MWRGAAGSLLRFSIVTWTCPAAAVAAPVAVRAQGLLV
jgi:hypothetical protein